MTPTLTPVPHDRFVADVRTLARAIEADAWTPDFIVGIGRGGLVPGCYLSHATGIPLLSVDYSSGVEPFGAQLLDDLARRSRDGTRVLLIDDINDSGRTIGVLRRSFAVVGGVAERMRIAVLIDNRTSSERVDYRSREIDRTTCKAWFVFPWEAMADREALVDEALAVPERLA